MTNRYLSRYAKHDTHFKRTDPWPHLPWAHDVKRAKWRFILGEVLGAVALLAVLVGACFIHEPVQVDRVEVQR